MLDPVTAIGLASGILSFVTFTASIVKGSLKIYKSGNLEEDVTLEDVIKNMSTFQSRLIPLNDDPRDSDVETLADLVAKSKLVLNEILELLVTTKPKGKDVRLLWKSMKASWERKISESKKRELETQIGDIERRTTMVLTQLTRVAVEKLVEIAKSHDGKLETLKNSISDLEKIKSLSQKIQEQTQRLIDTQKKAVDEICADRILEGLKYQKMTQRSSDLKNLLSTIEDEQWSHRDAFGWIYNSENEDAIVSDKNERNLRKVTRHKFVSWLSSLDGGIFHIAGKPGSGKSTMMKFLFDHSRTKEELKKWSGRSNNSLVMLHYSFVKNEEIQQKLDGLLRTLLHFILRNRREIISEVLNAAWKRAKELRSDSFAPLDISISEKLRALNTIFSGSSCSRINWCVFIDGLDEFQDPDKDMSDLVDLLQEWSSPTRSNVKLCVASRVEPPFTSEFDPDKRFLLHELTQYDMRRFAGKRLQKIPQAVREHLVEEIPKKAEGIFLWVYLVVFSIRQKVGRKELIEREVLDQFPVDLSPLLDSVIGSIAGMDILMAYRTIRMVESLQGHGLDLSLLAYWFFEDFSKNPSFAWSQSFPDMEENKPTNIELARQKLYGRCKGLVEAGPDGHIIKFIHRTVREHLEKEDVRKKFTEVYGDFSIVDAADAASNLLLAELRSSRACEIPERQCINILQLREHYGLNKFPYDFWDSLQEVMERPVQQALDSN